MHILKYLLCRHETSVSASEDKHWPVWQKLTGISLMVDRYQKISWHAQSIRVGNDNGRFEAVEEKQVLPQPK